MTSFHPLRLASLALLLGAVPAPALAQEGAPGACACPAPMAAPVVVVAPTQGWDGHQRWGIGLRLTSLALHQGDDTENEVSYAGGGLQLRYRLNARWELELSAEHVAEQSPDGDGPVEGGQELGSGTLAALFHMRPHSRWDWYLLAGIGGTQDARKELTDEQRKASAQAHVHLGIGLERRFRRFGIAAELRAVGMAPREDGNDAPVTAGAMTTPDQEQPETSGGQLNLAATYYF